MCTGAGVADVHDDRESPWGESGQDDFLSDEGPDENIPGERSTGLSSGSSFMMQHRHQRRPGRIQKAGRFEALEDDAEDAPRKLEFVLGPDTLHAIEKAKSSHARYAGGTERLLYEFSNYGKKVAQSCNVSPDCYVHMALQLAAFRSNRAREAIEPRILGSAARAFVPPAPSWCALEHSASDPPPLVYVGIAELVGYRLAIVPPFTKVNLQCDGATFMDPVFPDIYMVEYNIRPESLTFGLSCSKSCPEKDIGKFKDALEKALTDLRECVDRSC
ncbi:hypothetical protein HPB47_008354 [Ixodes persulcatus]|uniref:Uncharacterized protein n=1 Tax=Ixodes persulcatus TaxID=34615 RepID=A0AC60P5U1_IXOPE|nr:hypothetical protein HPB47_008354 [Ixodes persulcatus]